MSNVNENTISQLCYELYKLDWKKRHMVLGEREADSIKDYYDGILSEDYTADEYSYQDFIEENGYHGELYVCYDEFYDAEYHEKDYMCELLDNPELIALYYKDINEDNEF